MENVCMKGAGRADMVRIAARVKVGERMLKVVFGLLGVRRAAGT